jgi:hypothetical protein
LVILARAPLEAFRAYAQFQRQLEEETDGACSPGHLVIANVSIRDANGKVLVEGGVTHPTEDLNGPHPKAQSATFTKTPIFVDTKYIDPNPVPNSKDFFEKPESKVNIAKVKHDHKEDEYP